MSEGNLATLDSDDDASKVSSPAPAVKTCGLTEIERDKEPSRIRLREPKSADSKTYEKKQEECLQRISMANIHLLLNRLDAARDVLDRSLMVADEWLARDSDTTLEILRKLASVEFQLGSNKRALELGERLFSSLQLQVGDEHIATIEALALVASVNQNLRKFGWAELQYKKVLLVSERTYGSKSAETALLLRMMASLYFDKQDYKQAELLLKRVVSVRKELRIAADAETAKVFEQLGAVYCAVCRYKESEQYLKKALRLYKTCKGAESLELAHTRCELAKVFCATQRLQKAAVSLKAGLKIQATKLGYKDKAVKGTLAKLSGVYHAQGKFARSTELSELVMEAGMRADGS